MKRRHFAILSGFPPFLHRAVCLFFLLETASAGMMSQFGILDVTTNGGTNPATRRVWQNGDKYRFAFITSADTTALSTNIETYNAWVQGLADASTNYPIAASNGVTWKAIGSTKSVDAKDNTSTNPDADGWGHAIFLLDGSNVVAVDYEDLWDDGTNQIAIALTEQGTNRAGSPFTGTYADGTRSLDHTNSYGVLGSSITSNVQQGLVGTNGADWVWSPLTGAPPTNAQPMYALSEPLTVRGPTGGVLGILTEETIAAGNPATGKPWMPGDSYRFAFHTSVGRDAYPPDIEEYNTWVQSLADASPRYAIGSAQGVRWKVIGSTDVVDARDNTGTHPGIDGFGHAIFLLDGATCIATNYADLWDGQIRHVINITEDGRTWAYWPFTGTYLDGTKSAGHATSFGALGDGGYIGQGNAANPDEWIWRVWTGDPAGTNRPLYALSGPLTLPRVTLLIVK